MHSRPPFILSFPRFPWWGWIFVAPMLALGIFLGALFLLAFLAIALVGGLIFWIRWKWALRDTHRPGAPGAIRREYHVRQYDIDLTPLDQPDSQRRDQQP